MKPRWMRNHYGCPDCGKTFTTDEITGLMTTIKRTDSGIIERGPDKAFDCPHCKAHYAAEDFHDYHAEKWGYVPSLEEERALEEANAEECRRLREKAEVEMSEEEA